MNPEDHRGPMSLDEVVRRLTMRPTPLSEAVRNLSIALACVIVIAALAIATVYIVNAIHP